MLDTIIHTRVLKEWIYQILVETDFLVNYFEDHLETESIKKSVKKIFKTETGIRIATEMFFPEEFQISDTGIGWSPGTG